MTTILNAGSPGPSSGYASSEEDMQSSTSSTSHRARRRSLRSGSQSSSDSLSPLPLDGAERYLLDHCNSLSPSYDLLSEFLTDRDILSPHDWSDQFLTSMEKDLKLMRDEEEVASDLPNLNQELVKKYQKSSMERRVSDMMITDLKDLLLETGSNPSIKDCDLHEFNEASINMDVGSVELFLEITKDSTNRCATGGHLKASTVGLDENSNKIVLGVEVQTDVSQQVDSQEIKRSIIEEPTAVENSHKQTCEQDKSNENKSRKVSEDDLASLFDLKHSNIISKVDAQKSTSVLLEEFGSVLESSSLPLSSEFPNDISFLEDLKMDDGICVEDFAALLRENEAVEGIDSSQLPLDIEMGLQHISQSMASFDQTIEPPKTVNVQEVQQPPQQRMGVKKVILQRTHSRGCLNLETESKNILQNVSELQSSPIKMPINNGLCSSYNHSQSKQNYVLNQTQISYSIHADRPSYSSHISDSQTLAMLNSSTNHIHTAGVFKFNPAQAGQERWQQSESSTMTRVALDHHYCGQARNYALGNPPVIESQSLNRENVTTAPPGQLLKTLMLQRPRHPQDGCQLYKLPPSATPQVYRSTCDSKISYNNSNTGPLAASSACRYQLPNGCAVPNTRGASTDPNSGGGSMVCRAISQIDVRQSSDLPVKPQVRRSYSQLDDHRYSSRLSPKPAPFSSNHSYPNCCSDSASPFVPPPNKAARYSSSDSRRDSTTLLETILSISEPLNANLGSDIILQSGSQRFHQASSETPRRKSELSWARSRVTTCHGAKTSRVASGDITGSMLEQLLTEQQVGPSRTGVSNTTSKIKEKHDKDMCLQALNIRPTTDGFLQIKDEVRDVWKDELPGLRAEDEFNLFSDHLITEASGAISEIGLTDQTWTPSCMDDRILSVELEEILKKQAPTTSEGDVWLQLQFSELL